MDRAVDGGEGQPGPELVQSGSYGVHSWIEGARGDGRRVSWFVPQNQGGGRRLKTPSRGGTGVGLGADGGDGRRRRLGHRCGRGGDGRRLGPSEGRGGNGVQGHGVEAGIFPRVEFLRFSQNRSPHRVSRTSQNRGSDLHRRGGIAEKASSRRKKLRRRMRSCTLSGFAPMGILVYESRWRSFFGRDRSDRSVRPV